MLLFLLFYSIASFDNIKDIFKGLWDVSCNAIDSDGRKNKKIDKDFKILFSKNREFDELNGKIFHVNETNELKKQSTFKISWFLENSPNEFSLFLETNKNVTINTSICIDESIIYGQFNDGKFLVSLKEPKLFKITFFNQTSHEILEYCFEKIKHKRRLSWHHFYHMIPLFIFNFIKLFASRYDSDIA